MASHLTLIRKELKKLANPKKAKVSARFFKTGKGEYGEGDVFFGVTVPQTRAVAKKFASVDFNIIAQLLKSKIHEERLLTLIILVLKYKGTTEQEKNKIYEFYLDNTKFINNWDLVDLSAEQIVGAYLDGKEKSILVRLAGSKNIWERRISILSTFHFIKQGNSIETLKIAEILINDKHDLIQKAVGWMLREVGKKCSQAAEEEFLRKHYKHMPRVMLRYAIERFDEGLRKRYLRDMLD